MRCMHLSVEPANAAAQVQNVDYQRSGPEGMVHPYKGPSLSCMGNGAICIYHRRALLATAFRKETIPRPA
jgi:hypothetical protein